MHENQTFELILQRMLDRIRNNVDKLEGSLIHDANASTAVEMQLIYLALDEVLNESFGDTASREFLIRRARERGVIPFPATHAILRGEFTPANIDVIGRRFSMPNTGLTYIVESQISSGAYRVRCEQLGSQGNRFGIIVPIDHIQGLQTAELTYTVTADTDADTATFTPTPLIPARDEETTEAIRQRYFGSFRDKAYGGNVRYYLNNTNAIGGVGATKVTPAWKGGGTVKLTIVDVYFGQASNEPGGLIEKVQKIIDPYRDGMGKGLAPIGHVVEVGTVDEILIDITAVITLEDNTQEIPEAEISVAIKAYIDEERANWANRDAITLYISQVMAKISSVPGVRGVQNIKINGLVGNLTLGRYEIPKLYRVYAAL